MSATFLRDLTSQLEAYDISEASSPSSSATPPNDASSKPSPHPPSSSSSAPRLSAAAASAQQRLLTEMERRLQEKDKAMMELQSRLRHAEHTATLARAQVLQEKTEMQQCLALKQSELEKAKEEERKALSLHIDWPAQLSLLKDSLDDLHLTEALYLEWKGIKREAQTMREFVACKVYEMMRTERGHRDAAVSEAAAIREQLVRAESEMERIRMEKEQLMRSKRGRENELSDELRINEAAKRRLAEELTALKLNMDVLQVKGGAYDALQAKADAAEREKAELQQQNLMQAATMKALVEEKEVGHQRSRENEKKVELLTMDKLYLSKELEAAQERWKASEKERERLSAKVDDLRRHKEQVVEQLIKVREEQKFAYEDKLTTEISRLQDRTTAELDTIRIRQKEAYERDIASLREQRDEAVLELTQLKQLHAEAQQGLEQSRLAHSQLQIDVERERSEFRAALKVKAFEYERLGLTMEETMTELRKVKTELETEMKKGRITRGEYNKLKAEKEEKEREMGREMGALRDRVETYSQLEHELDLAIVGGAKGEGEGDGVRMGSVKGIHRILESVSENLPLSNKRRLQQSILLAQQLVEKQRLLNQCQIQLKEQIQVASSLQAKLQAANRQLEAVSQPQSYLISQLRQKDDELIEMREKVKSLEAEVEKAEKAKEEAVKVRRQMEADIRTLTSQRQSLTQLRAALMEAKDRSISHQAMMGKAADRALSPLSANHNIHQQTTVLETSAPSSVDLTFASPAPTGKGEKREIVVREGETVPPMWFRKLQQHQR